MLQRGPLPQHVGQTLTKTFRASEVTALPRARGCDTNASQRTFRIRVQAQARGPRDDNWVTFDGEEEWDDGGPSGLSGPIVQQSFRAVGMVIDRVTDIALQMAPEDASPTAVRAAVSGGLILLSLSFVKGIISFFITIGTIVFGAFVAVKVFGLDVGGSSNDDNNRRGRGSREKGGRNNRSTSARSSKIRDPPSLSSGVAGLINRVLGGSESESDDGLIDVWFERKSGKGKKKK